MNAMWLIIAAVFVSIVPGIIFLVGRMPCEALYCAMYCWIFVYVMANKQHYQKWE